MKSLSYDNDKLNEIYIQDAVEKLYTLIGFSSDDDMWIHLHKDFLHYVHILYSRGDTLYRGISQKNGCISLHFCGSNGKIKECAEFVIILR